MNGPDFKVKQFITLTAKHLFMKSLFLLFCLLSLATLSGAQSVETFTLVAQNSNVQFQIDSQLLPINGKIEKFSGRLVKTGKAQNQFQLILDCDLASVRFTGEETKGLPISEMLSSVKNSSVHFEGKPIGQRPDGSLRISGDLKWRGKVYQVTFPVKVKRDELQFVLDGNIKSNGDDLVSELPVLAVFQVQAASANGKLIFRKLPSNMNSTLAS